MATQQLLTTARAETSATQQLLAAAQAALATTQQQLATAQAQAAASQQAIASAVNAITASLRTLFHDPSFTIPGATPQAQLQAIVQGFVDLAAGRYDHAWRR